MHRSNETNLKKFKAICYDSNNKCIAKGFIILNENVYNYFDSGIHNKLQMTNSTNYYIIEDEFENEFDNEFEINGGFTIQPLY